MTCAMLLSPHANARYMQSIRDLSLCELQIITREISNIRFATISGLELLLLDAEPERMEELLPLLGRHSSCQAVFELRDGWLRPLPFSADWAFDSDIASVLKYKGKTNERFTHMLINIAAYSGNGNTGPEARLLDPMCGRGTTLFQALRLGYSADGIDTDKKDIQELHAYFSRYLEYHKVKHQKKKSSMTVGGKSAGDRTVYTFGAQSLSVIHGDTRSAASFFKASSFDALAVDLPYGIQHASMNGPNRSQIDDLLRAALPAWHSLLKKGAAAALSFNVFGISREALRGMMAEAGFVPLTGGPYDGMRHWVEQAVTRDVAVGVKE